MLTLQLKLRYGGAVLDDTLGGTVQKYTNLVKLSVGTESVEGLIAWQEMRRAELPEALPRHVTRMWPKREDEILQGGSIFWVIKGLIQCRQRVLRLDEVIGEDGIRRCAIILDPEIHRTTTAPKRPFQGWRYLKPEDSPPDLTPGREQEDALPEELSQALADIGVL
ncbi:hypothetical protein RSK20926_13214 [Roseobacter sp. SK209-2-6]|nr:hypothetical protein RSK20926_13214 [Roseobacter sp. SK209-2-6]